MGGDFTNDVDKRRIATQCLPEYILVSYSWVFEFGLNLEESVDLEKIQSFSEEACWIGD